MIHLSHPFRIQKLINSCGTYVAGTQDIPKNRLRKSTQAIIRK